MTENSEFDTFIPPVSSAFQNKNITLLDRLRRWPEYERTRDERSADCSKWLTEVFKRTDRGDPRRVLFIHGQLPGETGSGVYMQQIVKESIRQGIDTYVLSAGYHMLDETDINGKTALMHASEGGHTDIVDLLRQSGA